MTSSATTWYGTDALGSVRQTLDVSGAVLTNVNYDPWRTVSGTVPTFGFTGELQAGLTHYKSTVDEAYTRKTSRITHKV